MTLTFQLRSHRSADPASLLEMGFLLAKVGAHLHGAPPPPPPPNLDWDETLAHIGHHRLEPLVAPGDGMPKESRRRLHDMRLRSARTALTQACELAHLAKAFAAADVEMLALKGPAFAVLLYGDPAARFSRDIDLLVRPEMEKEALAVLFGCGYGTTPTAVVRDANVIKLLPERGRTPVELHVRLGDDERLLPKSKFSPFDAATVVKIADVSVSTLDLEPALAYAAYHGGKHHWSRLYWLADIAFATTRRDVEWGRVADIARRAGIERYLGLALSLSAVLLGAEAKNAPPLTRRSAKAINRAKDVVFDLLCAPRSADLVALRRIGQFRVLRADLGMYTRLSARRALLSLRVRASDADRQVVALPEKLAFLYFAVRICRVLVQRLSLLFFSPKSRAPSHAEIPKD
jgi:hypothetical protein